MVSYSNKTVCACYVEYGKHNKDFYQSTRSLRKEGFYFANEYIVIWSAIETEVLILFHLFFSAGALVMLTISITKLFWKFAVWRCVDDLVKHIYRFHVRYIHSSFYLIRSIFNVYFVTSLSNVCFRTSLWCSSTGCT